MRVEAIIEETQQNSSVLAIGEHINLDIIRKFFLIITTNFHYGLALIKVTVVNRNRKDRAMLTEKHNPPKNLRSVQPIKRQADIDRIRSHLSEKPRDLLLFDLAIQTGLKMKDLLSTRVRNLLDLEVGDKIRILEEPSGGSRTITMSERIHQTLHRYLAEVDLAPDDYLFKSRKGPKAITLSTVSNIIKGWFQSAEIKGSYGAKSLRKTWEYFAENNQFISRDRIRNRESSGILEPIERLPVQEQIYNKLLEGIATGKITPGTKLVTGELSKMFKVSPTPVRMALSRLEARGFIISQKKKAYYVDQLSLKSLKEIITIRLALETLGVKLCCSIRSEETIQSLESLVEIYEQADEFDTYQQTNKQFHLMLCRDADMQMLQQMISDLCDRVTPYFVLFTEKANREAFHQENITVHRQILESYKRRDPRMASKWLEADLKQSLSTIREILERRENAHRKKAPPRD